MCLLLAGVYIYVVKPEYLVSSKVWGSQDEDGAGVGAKLVKSLSLGGGGSKVDDEVLVFRSPGDFVVDRSCRRGDVVRGYFVDAVSAHYRYLVADSDIRNVCHVDHALVHADVAHLAEIPPAHDEIGPARQAAAQAVGIPERNRADPKKHVQTKFDYNKSYI